MFLRVLACTITAQCRWHQMLPKLEVKAINQSSIHPLAFASSTHRLT